MIENSTNASSGILPHLASQVWDINQWHNDFYLLKSMASNSSGHELHHHIVAALEKVGCQLAQIFTCYLAIVVYAELRHIPPSVRCNSPAARQLEQSGEIPIALWQEVNKMQQLAQKDRSIQAKVFELVSQVFLDCGPSIAFASNAGSRVAAAATQYMRGSLLAPTFVEQIFELNHSSWQFLDWHKMIDVSEYLLKQQVDAKNTELTTDKLLDRQLAIYDKLSPVVFALYDLGAQAALWRHRAK